jgi:two-component system CheB/CheR fusion protein
MTKKKAGKTISKRKSTSKMKAMVDNFPIVGIGASAGGLDAFKRFFTKMSSDSGMAFVLIPHLDPTHESVMVDIIRNYTDMDVTEIKDGMPVEPNNIYLIPPNKNLTLVNSSLQLWSPVERRGLRHPIDTFFRSMAMDQKERSICIILSGTGSEGTLGLKAVKEEGGLVIVQDPESAGYAGMPNNAISTQLVDYILPPEDIPEVLTKYIKQAKKLYGKLPNVAETPGKSNSLKKILYLVQNQTGCDFSLYKPNTINRRIDKRMNLHQIMKLPDYIRFLRENHEEVEILSKELLIGVTNFFRDKEAFDVLVKDALPYIFKHKPPGKPLRIWVAGCSTGEEAYSIAMVIHEHLEKVKIRSKVQIFATDIDPDAISVARNGLYPESISVDISSKRLKKFFTKEDGFYRIDSAIRDSLIFSPQDVISEPPFSKMDLVCCRNLLIYLQPVLQKKLFGTFHYSLNPGGLLFLGTSESIGDASDLFSVFDNKWKIYKRKGLSSSLRDFTDFPIRYHQEGDLRLTGVNNRTTNVDLKTLVSELLMDRYSPASVIINEKGIIQYFHGRTGRYLEPAHGKATLQIFDMAKKPLNIEIRNTMKRARTQMKEITKKYIDLDVNGKTETINLVVKPIMEPEAYKGMMMVMFEKILEKEAVKKPKTAKVKDETYERISELERELSYTKEHLQTIIEEQETSNEELKSLNEELQSSNEELQSTNEELETSQEELQSVNEELEIVNAELKSKIDEFVKTSDDMANLLASSEIATLFLDQENKITWFTPALKEIINVIQSDIGRSLEDISTKFVNDDIVGDAKKVLKSLIKIEKEMPTDDGKTFRMNVLPYRTTNNFIDGTVITFIDITDMKMYEERIEYSMNLSQNIVDAAQAPILILDGDMKVVTANHSFYKHFKVRKKDAVGFPLKKLGDGQWNIPSLIKLLKNVLPGKTVINDFKVTHDFEKIGKRTILLNVKELVQGEGATRLIIISMEDITHQVNKKAKE